MSWRGSTDFKDRFFSALVYALPLIDVLPYSAGVLDLIPQLGFIYILINPLLTVYNALNSTIPFAGLIIFFALWLGVVRNQRISHFIRFNTMQAILIDIAIILFGLVLQVIIIGSGSGLIATTLSNVIFLGVLVACIYGIIQSALGSYAEIPTISEAAYSQVR
ncbi:Tic20 family protein [Gloeocapsa sp. PCC 73106]|uniref:Tic20 family protein n=1 Tax=Gloeocapsa sp. PCC 73106 TaxID=102232 RepID=UPI0002AC10FE|nr:Tic20 family protein [Gloeocapsa sp. PCC 73106]ELR98379.1 import component protein Tic20-like protein [Gloeocapsa sp. PCC 73106]